MTIRVACGCSVSSLGLPTGRLPAYRVPGFVGQDGPVASRWAKGKLVAVRFRLSDLRRADAPSLLANYVLIALLLRVSDEGAKAQKAMLAAGAAGAPGERPMVPAR